MEMINIFSTANNAREFREKIPQALNVVKAYRKKMLNGEIHIEDLIISKRLSKNPKHYKQHVSQVIAAEQLVKEGAEVNAGKNVHFVFTDSTHKRFERRVRAEQLLDKGINPDERKYLQLLYASAASLLSFSKYSSKSVYDTIMGYEDRNICDFF